MESLQPNIFHWIFGVLTLASGLMVILSRNPVVSAMSLMATLFLTGTLFFGMGFYFVGAAQILIYAGAISVLFVFIVMLLDMKPTFVKIPGRTVGVGLGALAAVLLSAALFLSIVKGTGQDASQDSGAVVEASLSHLEAKSIALQLLSKFMIPFQLTGILILGAIMGVIILGRPKKTVGPSK